MVSWRESRLILIFILLMMVFMSFVAIVQFGVPDIITSTASNFSGFRLVSVPSPTVSPVPVSEGADLMGRAFPAVNVPANPVNPFE